MLCKETLQPDKKARFDVDDVQRCCTIFSIQRKYLLVPPLLLESVFLKNLLRIQQVVSAFEHCHVLHGFNNAKFNGWSRCWAEFVLGDWLKCLLVQKLQMKVASANIDLVSKVGIDWLCLDNPYYWLDKIRKHLCLTQHTTSTATWSAGRTQGGPRVSGGWFSLSLLEPSAPCSPASPANS